MKSFIIKLLNLRKEGKHIIIRNIIHHDLKLFFIVNVNLSVSERKWTGLGIGWAVIQHEGSRRLAWK